MKTLYSLFLLIQLLVPGASSVGDTFPPDAHRPNVVGQAHNRHGKDNPYAQIAEAFHHARCVQVKTVTLNRRGDTLIVDALRPYYRPAIAYPYLLLYASDVQSSIGLRGKGFTDVQDLRIQVSEPGQYFLVINDVNRSMLEFVVGTGTGQSFATVGPAGDSIPPAGLLVGELRIGCVIHE